MSSLFFTFSTLCAKTCKNIRRAFRALLPLLQKSGWADIPARRFSFLLYRFSDFPEYVKSYEAEFLQKLQLKTCIKASLSVMEILEKWVISKRKRFFSNAEVKEPLFPVFIQALIASVESRCLFQKLQGFLFCLRRGFPRHSLPQTLQYLCYEPCFLLSCCNEFNRYEWDSSGELPIGCKKCSGCHLPPLHFISAVLPSAGRRRMAPCQMRISAISQSGAYSFKLAPFVAITSRYQS